MDFDFSVIVKLKDAIVKFVKDLILGDFEDDPSNAAMIIGGLISLIPVVDQIMDARDVAGMIFRINKKGVKNCTTDDWVDLALAAFGCIPEVGSIFKTAVKPLWRNRKAIAGVMRGSAFIQELLSKHRGKIVTFMKTFNWAGRTTEAMNIMMRTIDQCDELLGDLAEGHWWLPGEIEGLARDLRPRLQESKVALRKGFEEGSKALREFVEEMLGEDAVRVVEAAASTTLAVASAVPATGGGKPAGGRGGSHGSAGGSSSSSHSSGASANSGGKGSNTANGGSSTSSSSSTSGASGAADTHKGSKDSSGNGGNSNSGAKSSSAGDGGQSGGNSNSGSTNSGGSGSGANGGKGAGGSNTGGSSGSGNNGGNGGGNKGGDDSAAPEPKPKPNKEKPSEKKAEHPPTGGAPTLDRSQGGGAMTNLQRATQGMSKNEEFGYKGLIGEHMVHYHHMHKVSAKWPHGHIVGRHQNAKWADEKCLVDEKNVSEAPMELLPEYFDRIRQHGVDGIWSLGNGKFHFVEAKFSKSAGALFGKGYDSWSLKAKEVGTLRSDGRITATAPDKKTRILGFPPPRWLTEREYALWCLLGQNENKGFQMGLDWLRASVKHRPMLDEENLQNRFVYIIFALPSKSAPKEYKVKSNGPLKKESALGVDDHLLALPDIFNAVVGKKDVYELTLHDAHKKLHGVSDSFLAKEIDDLEKKYNEVRSKPHPLAKNIKRPSKNSEPGTDSDNSGTPPKRKPRRK